jgi:Na+-transporting methylmalonyl-CoA/oxaloacetate decarboxylase gamma subunit
MHHKVTRIFRQLSLTIGPCILLGIAIAVALGVALVFYYLLIWGAVIGAVICLGLVIRRSFFNSHRTTTQTVSRTIDHDDHYH